ncbi:MAG: hypothetical protein HZA16_09320 [Nitrospirae bacterium]|nr:hypothetical protein [Nitrospirota bacterium]
MKKYFLLRFAGFLGMLLVLCAYYLFWISPDAQIDEAIGRTRIAVFLNLMGNVMIIFYFYKRQS